MATLSQLDLWKWNKMDRVERCIFEMESNGCALDTAYCESQAEKAQEDERLTLLALSDWLRTIDGWRDRDPTEFNWASPKQLTELFHDTLALDPSPIWKKGRVNLRAGDRKLDETALEWVRAKYHDSPGIAGGVDLLIHLRRVRGAIKYLTKLPGYVAPDGYVHAVSGPSWDGDPRAGTITWRLASKNPEILQIPTIPEKDPYRIRRAFIAPPGHTLIAADETALEAVIFAHILIELFDDHQLAELLVPGADLHAYNAKRVYGLYLGWERYGHRVDSFPDAAFKDPAYPELQALRQDIKAVWYGLMYGKSAYGFATSLRDSHGNPIGQKVAEQVVKALYAALPVLPRYQDWVLNYIQAHHGIPGLGGAWCDLSALTKSPNEWDLKSAHRIAQNYPMQEGGARIIGHAMVSIMDDPLYKSLGLLLERQVHDELDFRCPDLGVSEAIPMIKTHMTSYPLRSLLQVSIGTGASWDEC